MSLERREHPEARAELREAAHWYDDQAHGLGDDFYEAITNALARIYEWPHSAPTL